MSVHRVRAALLLIPLLTACPAKPPVVGVCTDERGAFLPSTTVCRAEAGPCDVEERCTGKSADCPTDEVAGSGWICRPKAAPCDEPERCSGTEVECPADRFAQAGAPCRPSEGPCDVAEVCPGDSLYCPPNVYERATVVCRLEAGGCDVPEFCTGGTAECPEDVFKDASYICRGETGLCGGAERCTGVSAECPDDVEPKVGDACEPDADPCTDDVCRIDLIWGGNLECEHPTSADGTPCGADTACVAGVCTAGCRIDGLFFPAGSRNPLQPCELCDGSVSQTAWTARDGLRCSSGGVCMALQCVADPENARWPVPPESPRDYQVTADTVQDRVTGLVWQRASPASRFTLAQARAYCDNLTLGGYSSGWRVPTLLELLTLVDSAASTAPTLDPQAFPNTPATHFWSASDVIHSETERWSVDFGAVPSDGEAGGTVREPDHVQHAVRCVHSEPVAPRLRYTAWSERVRDEWTGLEWERWPATSSFDRAGAAAYCQNLALDGGGWRLPRKKELESLHDRRSEVQAIDELFGPMKADWVFWSSTSCALKPGQYWAFGFLQGNEFCAEPDLEQPGSVRCVR